MKASTLVEVEKALARAYEVLAVRDECIREKVAVGIECNRLAAVVRTELESIKIEIEGEENVKA